MTLGGDVWWWALGSAWAVRPAMDQVILGAAGDRLGQSVLAAGDFDGDGDDDLVTTVAGGLVVLEGGPGGLSAPVPWLAARASQLLVLDADGDGVDDLLRLDVFDAARLHLGGPAGLGPEVWSGPVHDQFHAAAGDLDGDGDDDLVLVDLDGVYVPYQYPDDHQWLFVVDGQPGGLASAPSLRAHAAVPFFTLPPIAGVAVSDVDGDGFADLALLEQLQDLLLVHRGSAAGLEVAPTWTSSTAGHHFDAFAGGGDLDGDGYEDLALADNGIVVTHGGPNGPVFAAWHPVNVDGDPVLRLAPDLDGDGGDELLTGWPGAGGVPYGWWGLAGVLRSGLVVPALGPLGVRGRAQYDQTGAGVAGGDFDGDGANDWATSSPGSDVGGLDAGEVSVSFGPF